MARSQEKLRALELRRNGQSIKEIARKLKVSASSVSNWCKNVVLTPEQIKELEKHSRDPYYGKRLEYLLSQKRKKEEKIKFLLNQGKKEVGSLTKRELFLIGIALYWSKGFKKDTQAGFANSDPKMIKLFLAWLYTCFDYKPKDLLPRLTLNISHKSRTNKVIKYWSEVIGIPPQDFKKPFYQNVKWKKVYENPETYYGVLRIKVRKSKDFLRRIHGWIDGLREQTENIWLFEKTIGSVEIPSKFKLKSLEEIIKESKEDYLSNKN